MVSSIISILESHYCRCKTVIEEDGRSTVIAEFFENGKTIFTVTFHNIIDANLEYASFIAQSITNVVQPIYQELYLENKKRIISKMIFQNVVIHEINRYKKLAKDHKFEITVTE